MIEVHALGILAVLTLIASGPSILNWAHTSERTLAPYASASILTDVRTTRQFTGR